MTRSLFSYLALALSCLLLLAASCQGFMAPSLPAVQSMQQQRRQGGMSMMGGKVAKFGFFSPAVIVAKVVLGEKDLNKVRGGGSREGLYASSVCPYARVCSRFIPPPQPINPPTHSFSQLRGKAIALHSQAITEFCYFVGAQGRWVGGGVTAGRGQMNT